MSSRGSNDVSPRFLILFGLPFLIAGLAATWFLGLRPILKVLDARNWNETPARVLESEVRTHRGSDSTTYSIRIVYNYEVEGRAFTSERYNFMSGSSSGRESKARVVRQYPPGHEFLAFVNPANPAEAVIDRDFRWYYAAITGACSLFILVGAGAMLGGFRKAAQLPSSVAGMQAQTFAAQQIQSLAAGSNRWLPPLNAKDSRGRVTLQNDSSPMAAAIGLFFFALLWNGMLSVFLFKVWQDWQQGRQEIFMLLFLSPFILVGLGVIVFFFYTLLASFNPRVNLSISTAEPRLGDTISLDWNFTGAADRLRSLTIRLEGLERITYRSGKSTHSEENIFFRREVVSMEGMRALSAGSASLEFPRNLMHSFEATANKVIWRLVVHGRIDFWPDLRASFPCTVLPSPNQRS